MTANRVFLMKTNSLLPREIRRYNKQIMLDELGVEGQKKLKKAKVIVVGAGGLGCPVLQYIAAAGVGKIAIVEFDMVDETNLQRQVLYGSSDVGKLKSIIAKGRLEQLNNFCTFEIINLKLDAGNAVRIISDYDIVVDATDNFEARYAIDDACSALNKPMAHGAIHKFEGIVSVFNYKGGPTYRDYNPPVPDERFKNPDALQIGLPGTLPGIIGTFMANEVIKIITGIGEPLSGKFLYINILNNDIRTFSIT